jgi:hypothetical protein
MIQVFFQESFVKHLRCKVQSRNNHRSKQIKALEKVLLDGSILLHSCTLALLHSCTLALLHSCNVVTSLVKSTRSILRTWFDDSAVALVVFLSTVGPCCSLHYCFAQDSNQVNDGMATHTLELWNLVDGTVLAELDIGELSQGSVFRTKVGV